MPTSLFSEMDRCTNGGGAGSIEEQRALQLAFELSMLGLEGTPGCPGSGTTTVPGTNADPDPLQTAPSSVFEEARSKKSQNMTECVPVPSSEHVAEIVGRQGERTLDDFFSILSRFFLLFYFLHPTFRFLANSYILAMELFFPVACRILVLSDIFCIGDNREQSSVCRITKAYARLDVISSLSLSRCLVRAHV